MDKRQLTEEITTLLWENTQNVLLLFLLRQVAELIGVEHADFTVSILEDWDRLSLGWCEKLNSQVDDPELINSCRRIVRGMLVEALNEQA